MTMNTFSIIHEKRLHNTSRVYLLQQTTCGWDQLGFFQLNWSPLHWGFPFNTSPQKQIVGLGEEKLYDAATYRSIIGNNRRRGREVSQSND